MMYLLEMSLMCFFDQCGQKFRHLAQFPVSFRVAQSLIGFQRKLAVDHNVTWWIRQMDQAIRPRTVGQRGLQSIAIAGQRLSDSIVELNLAVRTVGLLVG